MLDERGVEYTDRDMFGKHVLNWGAPMVNGAMFTDAGEWTELVVENATPEQAIDATLGRGTCHNLAGQDEDGDWGFRCSECGAMPKYGSGEYHLASSGELPDGTRWLGDSWLPWRFCPCCGRKVAGE